MGSGGIRARATVFAGALLTATSVFAWPPCDETTQGSGCIDLSGGGTGSFQLQAAWDVDSQTQAGTLHYVDSNGNFTVDSNALVDYSYLDTSVRGFIFQASGANYNEVRVFIADYGSTGDQFEIQLLQDGNIVYDQFGYLSNACSGGDVVITSDCGGTVSPPPPPPPTGGKDHPEHPQHPDHPEHPEHPDHPDHPNHIKGNNGVGNGEDPQPPGNPPINDGPGTGPGNPGNRGGAQK